MLIRFRASNYLSFKDEIELSMISGAAQNHPDQIINTGKSNINVLRCAAIYGANASGKSNLIKVIEFAREFIINGVKRNEKITLKPFKLDPEYANKNSKFEFEFYISGKSYMYGFELTSSKVQSEWLYELRKTTEKMLFERSTGQDNKVKVDIGIKTQSKTEFDFLAKFSEGTRSNQLFLSKCYEDENIHNFDDIMKWFINLEFIYPTTKYKRFPIEVAKGSRLLGEITHFLQKFDTGVCRFESENMNPEGLLPKELIDDVQNLEEGKQVIIQSSKGEFFLAQKAKDNNIPEWSKIVFIHQVEDLQSEITFDMSEESDGTLRLIDLIPMLLFKNKPIFVDEIDRSIHPSMVYRFVELFLSNQRQSQLIFTTHEDHLLDQDLLRRDEVWFVEKDQNGASSLYSLEDFAPRKDLDIQKGYLQGRFGAIPLLGECNFLER